MKMLRSIFEGGKYFFRTFWISSIAITVLALSIGLIALAFNTRQLSTIVIRQFDKKATIQVLLSDEAGEVDIQQTGQALKEIRGVSAVSFFSKDQEKERLNQQNQSTSDYSQIFQTLGFNPFLNSYVVTPVNAEAYRTVVETISNINFTKTNKIERVVAKQDFIDRLTYLYNITNILGWAFVIFFGLISVVVIVNIVRISISYFQTEIEIQRLVGATNAYIQGPFVAQGFYFGFLASVIVGGLQTVIILALLPNFGSWFGITDINSVRFELLFSLGLILVVAILIATMAAWYSTIRYLKK